MTTLATLLGGIGLFLLGMWLMTEGLKLAAGAALRTILQSWTSSALRGLLAGILITAVVQSSSAVTVATVGFVNAGLLTLSQAVWVVFGTNVGTTMTGWLVALVGVKIDVGALALPLLGFGMLLRLMAASNTRRSGIGQALAGFGAFFLGVGILQEAFTDLAPRLADLHLGDGGWLTTLAFVGLGVALTILTQSSSAAIAIALTASAGGGIPLELAAATVVGTNIGTTSTAFLAAIGATAAAKRVATAHIVFNLVTAVVALALLPLLVAASGRLADLVWSDGDQPTTLAVFHTLFNGLGVALVWPLAPRLVRLLSRLYRSPEEEIGRPRHLDATLTEVPALALRGLVLELARMMDIAFDLARQRIDAQAIDRYASGRREEGLLQLGQAVRDFVDRLQAAPLPAEVVEALPDLLRSVQHLEELASITGKLSGIAPLPLDETARRHWADLREAVSACLQPQDAGPREPREIFAELSSRTEAAYQSIKADLLQAAARGRLPVVPMESALLYAQGLRRGADAAWKAQRRLLPWIARVDDRAPDQ